MGVLLDDEAHIPPSLTVPVHALVQLLSGCEANDTLYGEDNRNVLKNSTAARLRSILHNSRIVEGFLDEMGSQGESEEDEMDIDEAGDADTGAGASEKPTE